MVRPTKLQKILNQARDTGDGKNSRKEGFTLLKTLVYPRTLRYASITEIHKVLLRHVRPVKCELVERAKFHTLVGNQRQASQYNFECQLYVGLRDRCVEGINKPNLPRKLLCKKDTSFQNIRIVCETTEDLKNSTQEPAVPLY